MKRKPLKPNIAFMKFLFSLIFPLLVTLLFLTSCKTQKASGYLEDFTDTSGKVQVRYPEPLIKRDDVLSILVYSDAIDQGTTDAMYNTANGGVGASTQGYVVDIDGNIQFPRLGKIKAQGLTKPQLADEIKKRLTAQLSNPTVVIRLINFKITMLGEVARPGPVTLPSEKVTILEAVGLAGDVTLYGKKNDIVVLRQNDSTTEVGAIDLSSKKVFESPYYFLQQGDVVLVNPNKNKARLSDQVFSQRLGIAFGIINTIALLYNVFR